MQKERSICKDTILSRQFQMFAQQECQGSSPLYEHLANKIADDEDLLDIASLIPQGQPAPNLLLAQFIIY